MLNCINWCDLSDDISLWSNFPFFCNDQKNNCIPISKIGFYMAKN
nr:hypothetical protein [Candidatus Pantoea edessiphila]